MVVRHRQLAEHFAAPVPPTVSPIYKRAELPKGMLLYARIEGYAVIVRVS